MFGKRKYKFYFVELFDTSFSSHMDHKTVQKDDLNSALKCSNDHDLFGSHHTSEIWEYTERGKKLIKTREGVIKNEKRN